MGEEQSRKNNPPEDSSDKITRRQFLKKAAVLSIGLAVGSAVQPTAQTSSAAENNRGKTPEIQKVFSLEELIPHIKGWAEDGTLQAGTFSLDLDNDSGRKEIFLEISDPKLVQSPDYDRFLPVQLIRAWGGDANSFAQKLSSEWTSAGQPKAVNREQWLKILGNVSPDVLKRWQDIDSLPGLNLPEPKNRDFQWEVSSLPQEFLSIPSDEHRLVYWMAPTVGTTGWPLDQGRAGGREWASRKVGDRTYENWKVVATTSYNLSGPSRVGPEGSVPYMSPTPFAGYPPLGKWMK